MIHLGQLSFSIRNFEFRNYCLTLSQYKVILGCRRHASSGQSIRNQYPLFWVIEIHRTVVYLNWLHWTIQFLRARAFEKESLRPRSLTNCNVPAAVTFSIIVIPTQRAISLYFYNIRVAPSLLLRSIWSSAGIDPDSFGVCRNVWSLPVDFSLTMIDWSHSHISRTQIFSLWS